MENILCLNSQFVWNVLPIRKREFDFGLSDFVIYFIIFCLFSDFRFADDDIIFLLDHRIKATNVRTKTKMWIGLSNWGNYHPYLFNKWNDKQTLTVFVLFFVQTTYTHQFKSQIVFISVCALLSYHWFRPIYGNDDRLRKNLYHHRFSSQSTSVYGHWILLNESFWPWAMALTNNQHIQCDFLNYANSDYTESHSATFWSSSWLRLKNLMRCTQQQSNYSFDSIIIQHPISLAPIRLFNAIFCLQHYAN